MTVLAVGARWDMARKPRSSGEAGVPKRSNAIVLSAAEKELLARCLHSRDGRVRKTGSAELILSRDEIAFLEAASRKGLAEAPAEKLRCRLALVDRLVVQAESQPDAAVVMAFAACEAEWLDEITRDRYSFITPAERHARLILREKLHRAMEHRDPDPVPRPRDDTGS